MEDDKYINNIKEGITGNKLPTMEEIKKQMKLNLKKIYLTN